METNKKIILEISKRKSIIKDIVFDIIKVYKSEEEGEFYLPEYFNEEKNKYDYDKIKSPFSVELFIFPDYEVDNFLIDSEYFNEENVISISILYDPEKKINLIYNIIGELNEIITNEIRYIDQNDNDMFDFDHKKIEKSNDDPLFNYTQPHEIDVQVYGFKRLSKLRKIPFDMVVREWFKTHKDIHQLDKNDVETVINKIINYKNN